MAAPTRLRGVLHDSPESATTPRARLLALKQQADRESRTQERDSREHDDTAVPLDSGIEHDSRAGPESSGRHCATAEPDTRTRRVLQRWLPESVLGARLDPGRAGRLGLLLAAALALIIVIVTTWVDRPVAEPAPGPPLPVQPAPAAPAPPPPPPELVISVVGEVARPGLVTVRPGARVADALEAAGGSNAGSDITALNLARRLADGEQLYVAVPVPPGANTGQAESSPGTGTSSTKVDLNTATEEQLDALPGVGKVMAERIVQWRTEHGRFGSIDQLQDVDGIGETRLSKLRELVQV
ncbi:hypothetical protein GCM10027271_57990 [Saccharopolyspora gloriosae]|uniref:Competence protein ComEA n=1 Tax=Saccharopolyspora gloriosae TaxID=455344 RepID=A0A840NCN4_9PSEU|nr:ComEA family DNA-binding protein [Saccharopolyspora gloriosae]MBB5067885.1 competence protein ComEA [Saccharopolyspora gloriosae]